MNGAGDPVSGMAPELEEARALGELLKQGWRPKRTIVYAAWDGEEPGLLGSTEWVEEHADELRAARGRLHQHRRQRPRLPRRRRLAHARALRQRRRAGRRGSRDAASASGSARRRTRSPTGTAEERAEARDARGPADRRARLGLRLHAVPAAPRRRRRSTSASAATTTASTTRSTTTSTTTRTSSTPTSPTAARWRRRSARR